MERVAGRWKMWWGNKAYGYAIGALVVALSFVLTYIVGYYVGHKNASTDYELKMAELSVQAAAELELANEENAKASSQLRRDYADLQVAFMRGEENAKFEINRLRNSIHAGTTRLSVPVASCGKAEASGGAGASSGVTETERAELLPETAIDLINLAADADTEVRRTNLCINAYNKLKETLDKN